MGTSSRRVRRALAVAPALVALVLPAPVRAAEAWWQPLAFAGQTVRAVTVESGQLVVDAGGGRQVSTDGGRTFQAAGRGAATAADGGQGAVVSGGTTWVIRAGVVLTGRSAGALTRDARAPFLGGAAHLLAAPAATPGVVVAVGTDNNVWRRDRDGGWATAFVLLPAGGVSGVPKVTSVAAFTTPLSAAVYLGTAGYAVLLSSDGGDDWIRADPGLPANVLGLATDSATKALYAATDDGLYVHHLQSFPAPPSYRDSGLYLRWLGIGLVAVLATVLALLAMRRVIPVPDARDG